MPDIDLPWGTDFNLTPSGDLATCDGAEQTRQHFLRRLLTAVQGYIWHPEFGIGIPQRIGKVARTSVIAALVRAQAAQEATIARTPVPKVSVDYIDTTPGLYVISVKYTNAITGTPEAIKLEVPGRSR